jgi:hypothetical protein
MTSLKRRVISSVTQNVLRTDAVKTGLKCTVTCALVGCLILAASAIPAGTQTVDRALQKDVEALTALITDGFATFNGVEVVRRGTANTSLADDVVVLFSLTNWGGGNGTRQFLAVMEHHDADIRFLDGRAARRYSLLALVQAGADFDRYFRKMELRGDRIVLTGRRWAKEDAHCCPSIEASTSYRFGPYGLTEVAR